MVLIKYKKKSKTLFKVVVNALIHRTWGIGANTKIEMHPDKIIVSSPGGLMADMS